MAGNILTDCLPYYSGKPQKWCFTYTTHYTISVYLLANLYCIYIYTIYLFSLVECHCPDQQIASSVAVPGPLDSTEQEYLQTGQLEMERMILSPQICSIEEHGAS